MKRLCVLALLFAVPALADVVHLKDGSKLEGRLTREGAGWIVTNDAGKATHIGDDQVHLIQKTSNLSADQLADQRLTSLRRAVDGVGDAAQAIDRLTRFIEQNPKTKAIEEARKDIALWQDRIDRKLVRVGDQWITSEEHSKMAGDSARRAGEARELLKQNRQRDADAVVTQILTVDPGNVAGLYLRGLLQHRQGEFGPAKRSFELLREKLPDHAPTLNNLGVILWQQKQTIAALTMYEQAMATAPHNRIVLDNTLEALNALSPRDARSTVAQKAAKRVQEQDTELQKELAAQGLYRWGATYVTEAQMAEVRKVQEGLKVKLDALRQDWEKLNYRLDEIDRRIESNDDSIRRIVRDRMIFDRNTNRYVQAQLPSTYYELKRENDRLESEATNIHARIDAIPGRKALIEQESPHPAYTGVHRMIDVEGTPLPAASASPQ